MKKGLNLNLAAQWIGSSLKSNLSIHGASVDSRLTKNGDLFFACPGNKNDGHAFLSEASKRGAVAAVVSEAYSGEDFGLPLIHVANPEKSLQELAKKFLASLSTTVVAVTGSAGKTTTKGFLTQLLATKYQVSSTPGNYNSQLGLPLTILNHISEDAEYAVLEMGMTQAGHIASLVQIAPPSLAIITGVSLAHAENFSSLEEIGKAKAEILSHPKTSVGIIDRQIVNFDSLADSFKHCQLVSFGYNNESADYALTLNENSMSLIKKREQVFSFDLLDLPGIHNRHNFLGAALAAYHCGVEWNSIQDAIPTLSLPPMRLQLEERQGVVFINDAYNALPAAVKGALDSLPEPKKKGRKIAVFSEMRELGVFSEECHKNVAEYALDRIDMMFCLGSGCAPMHTVWAAAGRSVNCSTSLDELIVLLKKTVRPDDVVLVKGSRSSGLSTVLDHF